MHLSRHITSHPAHKYAVDCINGRKNVCEHVRNACHRYVDDLKNLHTRGWTFDVAKAQQRIDFVEALTQYLGEEHAGKPLTLSPWQQFILWNVYGFWHSSNPTHRRFKYIYLEVPKKNGKTTMNAGIALIGAFLDGEAASEVYTAATNSKQAKICFNDIKKIIEATPELAEYYNIEIWSQAITGRLASGSAVTIKYLSKLAAGKGTQDGPRPYYGIIDEYHGHDSDDIFENLKSSSINRRNALMSIITTSGFNMNGPCYSYREMVIKILKGVQKDDTIFGLIYTLDDGDDWHSKVSWKKANPNWGVSVIPETFEQEYTNAVNQPSKQYYFKTKHLDLWQSQTHTWIDDEVYQKGLTPFTNADLKGQPCWGGIDLASTRNVTSFALIFPQPGDTIKSLTWFWVPEESLIELRDKGMPYWEYVSAGHMFVTPGNTTDYDFIQKFVEDTKQQFDIKKIGIDNWNSSQFVINLNRNRDFDNVIYPVTQNIGTMTNPAKLLEKYIYDRKWHHPGNPCMRYHISNCQIWTDANGNIKPVKGKNRLDIDGVIANINALSVYNYDAVEASKPNKKIYKGFLINDEK